MVTAIVSMIGFTSAIGVVYWRNSL